MQTYKAPLRDMRFVLHELHDSATLSRLRGLEDVSPELMDHILEEAAKVAEEVLLPINASGDEDGCVLENGVVRTPKGFKEAYGTFRQGGWTALSADPRYGGQGLPESLNKLVDEMFCSANLAFGLYPGLTHGACQAIASHARDELKDSLSSQDGRRHLVRHHVPDRAALRHRPRPAAHPRGPAGGWQPTGSAGRKSSSAPASTT